MFEVCIHGRAGQGVTTAAELLAIAAFREGRHAQAFPSAGMRSPGQPVVAHCRIADEPIHGMEPIVSPDAVIVLEPTLLHQPAVSEGLRPDGYLLINSTRAAARLGFGEIGGQIRPEGVLVVPGIALAMRLLDRDLPNTALLGGFAAATGVVSEASVAAAIRERFDGPVAQTNVAAASEAFALMRAHIEEFAHARLSHGAAL
jgi:pyruvate ferredoxin oxidoreductase gamma subunit